MNNTDVNHKNYSNNSRKLYGLFLCIITVIVILLILFKSFTAPTGSIGMLPDIDVGAEQVGSNKWTPEELSAYLQKEVDKSQFSWGINTNISLVNGTSSANAEIINPQYNVFPIVCEITLDDSKELIYKSGAIMPNYYIQNIKFRKPLNKGNYKATATIYGYDPDTKQQLGKAQAEMNISVLN